MRKSSGKNLKSVILSLIVFLLFSSGAMSQGKADIRFNAQGKFKIVQFTDIHLSYNTTKADSVITLIRTVLEEENPDLIVVTGDIVCSDNTMMTWLQLTKVFIDAKIPWAVTFGNHDDEYEMTRQEIIDLIKDMPYCLTINGPANIYGHGNYILRVKSSDSPKTAALLYCFDSNSYSPIESIKGYGWIKFNQIEWYRKQSELLAGENRNIPYPALAFFHIPLPEYKEIIGKASTVGIINETPCSPPINSGLFSSMAEKGDVMGIFTGHDHDNNYIGCLNGICLAYGTKTGLDNYGALEKGARIIELYENERKFRTWIRSLDSNPEFQVIYPDSFTENKTE